jgi:hypothetical protein
MIVGTPDVFKKKMDGLLEAYDVDEVVLATFADTAEERLRSYELIAKLYLEKSHISDPMKSSQFSN